MIGPAVLVVVAGAVVLFGCPGVAGAPPFLAGVDGVPVVGVVGSEVIGCGSGGKGFDRIPAITASKPVVD